MTNKSYKLIGWHVLMFAFTLPLWNYGRYVIQGVNGETSFDGFALTHLALIASIAVLGFALFKNKKWALSMAGIVGFLFLIRFGWTWLNILGVGILFLTFLWSRNKTVGRINKSLKVDIFQMVRIGSMPFMLGIFILLSFATYQSPKLQNITQLPPTAQAVVDNLVNNALGPKIEAQTPEMRQNILQEISKQTFNDINTLLKPYFKYAPPILAFALFLVLLGLGWLFTFISAILAVGIFLILKKTKLIIVEEVDAKAERMII